MTDRRIYFPLWQAGLFNQVMSLEVAVGLCHLLRREVILTSRPRRIASSFRPSGHPHHAWLMNAHHPALEDLLHWPHQSLFHQIHEELPRHEFQRCQKAGIAGGYIIDTEIQSASREEFADGRRELIIDPDRDLLCRNTLSWYSRYFCGRSIALDHVLSRVKFHRCYTDLAERISSSLGSFNAAHIRLADFPEKICALQQEQVEQGIALLQQEGKPIIIATDEPAHPFIVHLTPHHSLIENLILDQFHEEFRRLPFHDSTVLGLITSLVLSHASDFIGTQGSTFSGYIHRQLHQKHRCRWRFFSSPQGLQYPEHSVSWTHSPTRREFRNWWQEWPECRLTSQSPGPEISGEAAVAAFQEACGNGEQDGLLAAP